MPVLPDVGSTMVVLGPTLPARSAASIMERPMRSFTDESGLKNSSLASTSAFALKRADSLGSRTSGVSPIVSRIDS